MERELESTQSKMKPSVSSSRGVETVGFGLAWGRGETKASMKAGESIDQKEGTRDHGDSEKSSPLGVLQPQFLVRHSSAPFKDEAVYKYWALFNFY